MNFLTPSAAFLFLIWLKEDFFFPEFPLTPSPGCKEYQWTSMNILSIYHRSLTK